MLSPSKHLFAVVNLTLIFIVCLSENVSHPNNQSISTHKVAQTREILKTEKSTRNNDKFDFTTKHTNVIILAKDCLARNKYTLEPRYSSELIPGEIPFTLGARNLPSMDPNDGAPDPLAKLRIHGEKGNSYATTSAVGDDQDPDWPDVFSIFYTPGIVQEINIHIQDKDPIYPDDSIGWVTFTLVEILEPCSTYYTVICNDSKITGALLINRPCGGSVTSGATNKIAGYLLYVLPYFVIKRTHL